MGEAAMTLEQVSRRDRLERRDHADVVWFFTSAAGDLGERGMNLEGNRGKGEFDDMFKLNAASRYRRISWVFGAMPLKQARVLQRFYEPVVWRGLEAFGQFAGVALRSPVAKATFRRETRSMRASDALDGAFDVWLRALAYRVRMATKSVSQDDRDLVRRITAECDVMVSEACRSYTKHSTLQAIAERKGRKARLRYQSESAGRFGDDRE
ncbi:MAG TPA: hypothetical protein VFT22_10970 [Kofleriaceae bacterium]|nr:hypothetical protein [Kofleriaceae bacterium]